MFCSPFPPSPIFSTFSIRAGTPVIQGSPEKKNPSPLPFPWVFFFWATLHSVLLLSGALRPQICVVSSGWFAPFPPFHNSSVLTLHHKVDNFIGNGVTRLQSVYKSIGQILVVHRYPNSSISFVLFFFFLNLITGMLPFPSLPPSLPSFLPLIDGHVHVQQAEGSQVPIIGGDKLILLYKTYGCVSYD